MPTPAQMNELLKERRTIREFTPTSVDRRVLEEVTSYAAYAPTHAHGFGIVYRPIAPVAVLVSQIVQRRLGEPHSFIDLAAVDVVAGVS